jgi:proteic killer suppression protein
VIEKFGDDETRKIYEGKRSARLPEDIQHRARRKLRMLNQARELRDLSVPPSNRLESMKGNLQGSWSVRINNRWRIIFHWDNGTVRDAQIIDDH